MRAIRLLFLLFSRRNIGFLMFQFLLPSIQVILFCLAIGRTPTNLHMSVYNTDTGNYSQLYLDSLDSSTIALRTVDSMQDVRAHFVIMRTVSSLNVP
jgi:hypothetical protein